MPVLPITVREKLASYTGNIPYICGNSDYLVRFDFDNEWDAYPQKTARFVWGSDYTDVMFEGNDCPFPLIESAMTVVVGVFAGNLKTTTGASVSACYSIRSKHGSPAAPKPNVYDRIMETLVEYDGRLDKLEEGGSGGGGIVLEDDGEGNIVLRNVAGEMVEIEDDGEGNLVIGGIG